MDYSGQELRLIAEGSQDPTWLNAFRNGEDVHGKVASMVFDVDISKVKDKPDVEPKSPNIGVQYKGEDFKLKRPKPTNVGKRVATYDKGGKVNKKSLDEINKQRVEDYEKQFEEEFLRAPMSEANPKSSKK